jgi:hypothetical protein
LFVEIDKDGVEGEEEEEEDDSELNSEKYSVFLRAGLADKKRLERRRRRREK